MAGEEIMDKSRVRFFSENLGSRLTAIASGKQRDFTPVLFFAGGLFLALALCLTAENILISHAAESKILYAKKIENRAPYFTSIKKSSDGKNFVAKNPFGTDEPADAKAVSTALASEMVLKGTIPEVAAWIDTGEKTHLLLLGQEVGGYTLKKISYSEVLLEAGKKQATLYMSLSGSSSPDHASGISATPSVLKKAGINKEDIIPAKNGQDGSVPTELVDKLLMDPYDEMAKMRMLPAEGGGIQIARIEEDSVLGLVGVTQGDIVKSINNIEISNLGDAANAVNSIMSGTRLDVTVIRNGKPVQLNYQVR